MVLVKLVRVMHNGPANSLLGHPNRSSSQHRKSRGRMVLSLPCVCCPEHRFASTCYGSHYAVKRSCVGPMVPATSPSGRPGAAVCEYCRRRRRPLAAGCIDILPRLHRVPRRRRQQISSSSALGRRNSSLIKRHLLLLLRSCFYVWGNP